MRIARAMSSSQLRLVLSALPALLLLGGVMAGGALLRLTAFALTASVGGSLAAWGRATRGIRRPHAG